jgi:hypothetical protein
MDLKAGTAVLEQRAREELGLTAQNELFFHFIDEDSAARAGAVRPADGERSATATATPGQSAAKPEAEQ